MVLIANKKTGGTEVFSIKPQSCPAHIPKTNRNYKKIERRLKLLRERAKLGLDLFPKKPKPKKNQKREK